MNKPIVLLSVVVGVVLVIVAVIYFIQPANALPSFLPGYDVTEIKHHYKHGVASLLLGLAAFALAWFQSGKKSKPQQIPSAQ